MTIQTTIKRDKYIFTFVFLLSCCAHIVFAANKKNVLYISSYNSSFPTFFRQIDGLKSVFDTMNVSFDVEFMDSKRLPSPDNNALFKDYISYKMASVTRYDAVISSDDHAFNFVLQNQDSLFIDIPIVFCGVNNIDNALSQNKNPQVTGVVESVSMEETIELMVRLFPDREKIYALVDGTASGQGDLKTFYHLSKKFQSTSFQDVSLTNLSFKEFATQLGTIDPKNPVLLLSAYNDNSQVTIDFEESLKLIREHLNAPLFHLWYHGMGDGVLGGKLISHYEQGRAAALQVCQIFSGHSVSSLKVTKESPNRYIFDYNELERFSIDKNILPNKSLVINLPQTFYSKNKTLILITIIIISSLIVFIAGLSVNNIQRRRIATDLLIKNNEIAIRNDEIAAQNEEFLTLNEELNQTNQELIISKKKAEESDALKTEFINNISHEIRTPMNGILGFTDIIMQLELSNKERNTYLNYILNNGQRLMHIIDDIIELSKLGTKQVKLLNEDICLNKYLDEIFLIFSPTAKEKNIDLMLNKALTDKESSITIDSNKVSKVINILIDNALKFTNEGFVELGYMRHHEMLELYVKDTGIGIETDKQELIFERFQQVEKEVSQKADGIGLGLSIAKELTTLLGGEIIVESQKNQGSVFTVKIPMEPVAIPNSETFASW